MAVTNRLGNRVGRTYRVVFSHAGPTGDALELVGATGVTVTVRELVVAKPSVNVTLAVIKRGTADTGTATSRTPVPTDSNFLPGSATVKAYTVVPGTIGAAVGTVDLWPIGTADVLVRDYTSPSSAPIILRGTGETLALNFSGTATLIGSLEWTEE